MPTYLTQGGRLQVQVFIGLKSIERSAHLTGAVPMGCFSDPLSWVEIYVQSWTNLGEQRKIDSDQVEVTRELSEIVDSVSEHHSYGRT